MSPVYLGAYLEIVWFSLLRGDRIQDWKMQKLENARTVSQVEKRSSINVTVSINFDR